MCGIGSIGHWPDVRFLFKIYGVNWISRVFLSIFFSYSSKLCSRLAVTIVCNIENRVCVFSIRHPGRVAADATASICWGRLDWIHYMCSDARLLLLFFFFIHSFRRGNTQFCRDLARFFFVLVAVDVLVVVLVVFLFRFDQKHQFVWVVML